jgi:predicted RecB family endonuclease
LTTEELFKKNNTLQSKKSKNEAAVPLEVLQTKYKEPYEKLCNELREVQKDLRLKYIESIKNLNELASKTVYMNFNTDEAWEELKNEVETLYIDSGKDFMMKQLLIGFCNGLDLMNKEEGL